MHQKYTILIYCPQVLRLHLMKDTNCYKYYQLGFKILYNEQIVTVKEYIFKKLKYYNFEIYFKII